MGAGKVYTASVWEDCVRDCYFKGMVSVLYYGRRRMLGRDDPHTWIHDKNSVKSSSEIEKELRQLFEIFYR